MKTYADLSWTPDDVLDLVTDDGYYKDWTVKDAEDFLLRNQAHIRDRLCEMGWSVIGGLLDFDRYESEVTS